MVRRWGLYDSCIGNITKICKVAVIQNVLIMQVALDETLLHIILNTKLKKTKKKLGQQKGTRRKQKDIERRY